MNRALRGTIRALIPLLLIAAAAGIAWALVRTKPSAKRAKPAQSAPVVSVIEAERAPGASVARAQGVVEPEREARVGPEVSGRVVRVADAVRPGGLVREGDELVRVDASPYELALGEQRAALSDAEARLAAERGNQAIAEREWALFAERDEAGGIDASLALRKPQLAQVEAGVAAAKARAARAALDVRRARVRAPFDAVVTEESVERGALVGAQTPVITLVATDAFRVRVSVPVEELGRLSIPGLGAEQAQGSEVTIVQRVGGDLARWSGRVSGLGARLDAAGGLAQLFVRVPDPLGRAEDAPRSRPPLLLGSYVEVELSERAEIESGITIPRRALRENDAVWVLEDDALSIRRVEVGQRRRASVTIRQGVEPGELVITSPLGAAVEGMALRRAPGPDRGASPAGAGSP